MNKKNAVLQPVMIVIFTSASDREVLVGTHLRVCVCVWSIQNA